MTGEPAFTFGMLTGLAVDEEGRINVSDHQEPAIRRYSPDGQFIEKLGRGGEGPGEYEQPLDLLTLPDGTVALWDFGNRRINLYEPDDGYLDAYRVPTSALMAGRMLYADTSGGLYVRTTVGSRSIPSRQGLVRLSPGGVVVDTLLMPERDPDGAYHFRRETLWTWTSSRQLVVGDNGVHEGEVYRFTIRNEDGSTVTVSRSIEAVELTGEERTEWTAHAAWRERRERRRGRDVDFPALRELKPAFKSLDVDEEGRIWVHRYVRAEKRRGAGEVEVSEEPALTWLERPTYDVFGADGLFLGTVVLPHRAARWASRGRRVWAVRRGELDETYVVRFGLVPR